jgi:hypothetical protein
MFLFIHYRRPGNIHKSVTFTFKVKQSLFRPGQGLRVPGGWGSKTAWQLAHEKGRVVSPTHRPPLPARKYLWYSVSARGWVDYGNLTRDLPACSTVPQLTAPPRTPLHRQKDRRSTVSSFKQTTHKSTFVLKMHSLLHVLYKLVFMGHNNPFNVTHPTPSPNPAILPSTEVITHDWRSTTCLSFQPPVRHTDSDTLNTSNHTFRHTKCRKDRYIDTVTDTICKEHRINFFPLLLCM